MVTPTTPTIGLSHSSRVDMDTFSMLEYLRSSFFLVLQEASDQGLVVFDHNFNLCFQNKKAAELHQIPNASGTPFRDFIARSSLGYPAQIQHIDALNHFALQNQNGRIDHHVMFVYLTDTPRPFAFVTQQYNQTAESPRLAERPAKRDKPSAERLTHVYLAPSSDKKITLGVKALHRGTGLLILGESGTGKTELARIIHTMAGMADRPFVHVNCAAIPETLFESEMFGYEKGAFTGALASGKKGFVEKAAGGTLFLDEIGEVPLASQAKLLKFIADKAIQPLGANAEKKIDVRLIVATNKDLRKQAEEGTFRLDLYFRLAVVTLELQALRDRPDEIPHIIKRLLDKKSAQYGEEYSITPEVIARLQHYDFPGNIRELDSVLEYASLSCNGPIQPQDLPSYILDAKSALTSPVSEQFLPTVVNEQHEVLSLKEMVNRFEKQMIQQAIQKAGSKKQAATDLGIDVVTLMRKLQRDAG